MAPLAPSEQLVASEDEITQLLERLVGSRRAMLEGTGAATPQELPAITMVIPPGSVVKLSAPVVVSGRSVIIRSSSPAATITGGGATQLFDVREGGHLTLQGVDLSDGVAGKTRSESGGGGALSVIDGGVAELQNVRITGCSSGSDGGAIFAIESTVLLESVDIDGCSAARDGGAVYVEASMLRVSDSAVTRCHARQGGALAAVGQGEGGDAAVTLVASTLSDCEATLRGGLLYAGTSVRLSERTALSNGSALLGSRVFMDNAAVSYQLPAPPGHWMPISLCEVYREAYDSPCEATEAGTLGFCEKRRDQCPFVADVCDASGDCVPPEGCTPATFVQRCDWRRDPSLLGQRVYQFPGQPIDIDLPYACYAGILGSADATMQGSRLCAGACPSGKQCPAAATFEALDCEPGFFCPVPCRKPLECNQPRV